MSKKKKGSPTVQPDSVELIDNEIPIGKHMGILVSPAQSAHLRRLLQEISESSKRNANKRVNKELDNLSKK